MKLRNLLGVALTIYTGANQTFAFEVVDAQHGYLFMDDQHIYQGRCPDLETLDVLTREMCYYDIPRESRAYYFRQEVFDKMDLAFKKDRTAADEKYALVLKETMNTDPRVIALNRSIASTASLVAQKQTQVEESIREIAQIDTAILNVSQIVANLEKLIVRLDEEIKKNGDSELALQKSEQAERSLASAKVEVVRLTTSKSAKEAAKVSLDQELAGLKAALKQVQDDLLALTTNYTPPSDHPQLSDFVAAQALKQNLEALWQDGGLGKFKRFLVYEGIPMFSQFFLPDPEVSDGEVNLVLEVMTRYFIPALAASKRHQ